MILAFVGGCYRPSAATDVPCAAGNLCPGDQVCDTSRQPPVCVDTVGPPVDAPMVVDTAPNIDTPAVSCGGGCPAAAPICDTGTDLCRGCLLDAECGSDVCNESAGLCVAEANALYVAPGAGITACTRAAPCGSISHAVTLLSGLQSTIKVGAGSYNDSFLLTLAGVGVLISGPTRNPSDVLITFAVVGTNDHLGELQGAAATIEGMTLQGGTGETLRAQGGSSLTLFRTIVRNTPSGGIDAQASTIRIRQTQVTGHGAIGIHVQGGTIEISQSAVAGNTFEGATLGDTTFTITNSAFLANQRGAISVTGVVGSGSVFDFNTVADNTGSVNGAMRSINAMSATNSIFSNNGVAPQLTLNVTAAFSLFSDANPGGATNLVGGADLNAANDPHLKATSAAIDRADPNSNVSIDIDGDHRPDGAVRDIGCDER